MKLRYNGSHLSRKRMKICDWLFPWRAKRYLEESDKLHSQLLSSLQSLTDQLTNLQSERQKLVDTYDKLQESYKDQITDITTMFHVEQSKLNEALAVAHENNKRVLGEKFGLLDEERESLTKRAVEAEEALKVSKEETVAEQRKIRALERWIKNVHRLDNESTEGTIKRIMQQSAMATRLFFIIGIMLMTSCVVAQQPPILRTFFDTNPAPIVDVVGGVGITVTPSTPNVQTRRFAVDATGSTVASNIYGSNVIGPVNLAISATNWIGMNVFSNQVYLDMTNLNTFTSNSLQQSMSNTVDYVSNILVLGSIDGSNQMHLDLTNLTVLVSNSTHLDMTNLNTFTSNSLQQSMSNYVNGNRDNTPAYVRSTFPENTNILLIQYSLDGDTWASITADGSAVWTNTLEVGTGVVLRDPSIMYDPVTSQFYVAFTHRFVPGVDPNGFTKYFGLISSSNLLNWYPVGTGLVPVITTNGQVFAPEWYQEGGTNWIIYSLNINFPGIGETHYTYVYGGNFTNWPLSTRLSLFAYDACISRRSNIWYLWITDSGIIPECYTNWAGVTGTYTHAKTGIEQAVFEGPNVIPWYGGWRMYYSASDHGECFYTTNNDPLTLYDSTASTNMQVEIPTNTVNHGTTLACTGDAKTKLLAAVCNRFNSTNTILKGTLFANISGVAYLASNQTFTGDNKFLGNYNVMRNLDVTNLDGAVDIPLRVRGPWDQSEHLQSWSTGSTVVAFMTAGGNFFANGYFGNGANLTNLTTQRQTFEGYVLEAGGIAAGDVVGYQGSGFISQTDIGIVKAKNNDPNTLPVLGIAYGSGPMGSLVTVVMYGDAPVNASAFFNGDYVYLGNNGNISTAPTASDALTVQLGVVTWGAIAGHVHVDIKPRYDAYSLFEQPGGNLNYILYNPLANADSGAGFVTRNNNSKWGSIGINNSLKAVNPDSQVINNSGIPMLFQIASNTAATISTSSNLSVGWFGQFSGNGSGLSNANGSGFISIKDGYATNINATNITLTGPLIMYGDNARTNGVVIGNYGEVLSNANGKVQISGGNITNSGYVISTNGLYMVCVTNNVAPPPNVLQPIGLFGSMMLSNVTNTVTVGSSGVYRTLTNYQVLRTNGFIAVPGWNGGYLTNTIAGYYKIFYYLSMLPGNSDMIEAEISVNGTMREEISGFGQFDTPARVRTVSGGGILYLPAMSYVSLMLNNHSSANNIAVWRAGFTIGTP